MYSYFYLYVYCVTNFVFCMDEDLIKCFAKIKKEGVEGVFVLWKK